MGSIQNRHDLRVTLVYVTSAAPGIRRRRTGRGFAYIDPAGDRLADAPSLARIRALAIPPDWRDVWICPQADGHLQAVGLDRKGRRQYLYHRLFRDQRDAVKFDHLVAFAQALPELRRQVAADIGTPISPR